MQITAQMVKELRELTGAGMMDCKKALEASKGDVESAIKWLRENDLATAEKKSGRIASDGIVDAYIHDGGRIGVLMEVNIETDFAAKNEAFKKLVRDLAMQVAAMNPLYVRREDVPADVVEHEREIARVQAVKAGKPEKIVDKIIDGRIEKYFNEVCLMEQAYIRDESMTCEQLVKEMIGKIGENIKVRRFVRYEMGEGLQKKCEDFAQEVASQLSK
ncbi:MAG TPA: translation elongation factor Ts [Clostridia bacterium]|nr:translation elongation factor Ts [Clostridia bacterium]